MHPEQHPANDQDHREGQKPGGKVDRQEQKFRRSDRPIGHARVPCHTRINDDVRIIDLKSYECCGNYAKHNWQPKTIATRVHSY